MALNLLKRIILSPESPKAAGPYSYAVAAANQVFISGQVGLDPVSSKLVTGGVEAETDRALKNLGIILKAAGGSYEHVVKTTVYLADMADFASVNTIYKNYFTSDYPARTCIAVKALPLGAKVEIEAIAVIGK